MSETPYIFQLVSPLLESAYYVIASIVGGIVIYRFVRPRTERSNRNNPDDAEI